MYHFIEAFLQATNKVIQRNLNFLNTYFDQFYSKTVKSGYVNFELKILIKCLFHDKKQVAISHF